MNQESFPNRFFKIAARFGALVSILICVCLAGAATAAEPPGPRSAGKPRLVKPGATPAGLAAADWEKIQSQLPESALSVPAEIKLTAADGDLNDVFGRAVAVAGDVAIVSAYGDDACKGAAYIFEFFPDRS
jgi:hypothetical protein